MKRILSIILCVAMLASMVSMTVLGADYEYGTKVDQVTTKNVMTFTTDKDSYKAGETVAIKVSMESIWGDPTIEDYIEGYEDYVLPGAYGMNILCSTLIYDKTVFTAKAHTDFFKTGASTINNADVTTVSGNNPIEAKTNGAYYLMAVTESFASSYEEFGFMTGSGDLWQYNLTIAADAAPGTYYLPVGPYVITDEETGAAQGKIPAIKFADDKEERLWAWLGNADSFFQDQPVEYKTNYTGGSRVAADSPKGDQYECSYVVIEIEGDKNEEDVNAAANVDALIDAIGTPVFNAGEVTKVDTINNGAPYTHIGDIPETDNYTISFKMMPIAGGETFGYFGGTTDADGGSHNIFWNAAEKKFQIAEVNNWVAPSSVDSVLAESEVMDLPENKWTEVEYIYNGSNLAVKVNGEIVCSTDSADTGYTFYIMYPNQAALYVKDMVATGDFGVVDFAPYFTADAYSTVTLDSGAAITAASEAYEALNANAKSLVTKKAVLDAAIAEYAAIADYDNQMAADKAIALIDAIGTVSYPASGDAIANAEEYVATLSETQLALVTNYETLTAARAEYDRREGLFNQAKADEVIGYIDAIGEVTFESRAAIETAEDAYAKLNDAQKALVTNYDVLVAAREAYNLYAPVMNAENLINAIGTEFYQGIVIHQNCSSSSGYANLPDQDGDNILFEFEFELDFMYASAKTETDASSNINVFRGSNSNAGYDFKTKSFFVGNNGGWMNSSNGPDVIYASAEYDLVPGKWYNLAYNWTAEGVVTMYLDGVEVLTCDLASVGGDHTQYEYAIFYPQNVDLYVGDYSHSSVRWGYTANALQNAGYGQGGVDVLAPVNVVEKIEAAEAAVAVLTAEQAALLDKSYTDALAAAKATVEPLYAELVAAAADVEALIAAIADADDITAAADAYNALLPGAKTLVKNYADLEAANANLVVAAIDALGEITPASAGAIAAAEAAYGALTNAEKAMVSNYATLEAARKELNSLNVAIATATNAINMLQANGSVLKNVADNYSTGSYSQILDKAENISGSDNHAPYTFSLDVLVESVNAQTATVTLADEVTDDAGNVVTPAQTVDVDVAYIGWASGNDVFVAYDLANKKFVVAESGAFKDNYAETLAGLTDVYGEAAYDLALNTWYNLKFVVEADYVEILVDGESVLKVAVDVNGYNIFYPVNNTAYYDNYTLTYNGAVEDAIADWARIDTDTWVAHNGSAWSVASAPSTGAVKYDADLVAAARAAYDAVPAKAQYAVANYDILVEAESYVPEVNPADDVQVLIDALDVPATTYKNYADVLAAEDAIAEAKAAYDALTDEQKADVDTTVLDAALAAYYKALNYNVALNPEAAVVPANVAAIGGEGEITVSWDAVDNAVKYWVYVDGVVVAVTTDTTITVAAEAGEHTVKVAVAINANAAIGSSATYVSGTSDEVTATVAEVVVDTVTVNTDATENSITASWDAVDGAVYYVTFNIGGTEVIVKTKNTTYTLAKFVTAETDYTVSVQALVANGKGGYDITVSDVAEGTTPAKAFQVIDNGDTITWTAVDGATIYWSEITSASGKTTTVRYNAVTEIKAPATAGEYNVKITAYAAGKYSFAEATIVVD